jgi:deoxyhypusine synthase
MVFSEATLAIPLIAGYAYHKGAHKGRTGKKWAASLDTVSP